MLWHGETTVRRRHGVPSCALMITIVGVTAATRRRAAREGGAGSRGPCVAEGKVGPYDYSLIARTGPRLDRTKCTCTCSTPLVNPLPSMRSTLRRRCLRTDLGPLELRISHRRAPGTIGVNAEFPLPGCSGSIRLAVRKGEFDVFDCRRPCTNRKGMHDAKCTSSLGRLVARLRLALVGVSDRAHRDDPEQAAGRVKPA